MLFKIRDWFRVWLYWNIVMICFQLFAGFVIDCVINRMGSFVMYLLVDLVCGFWKVRVLFELVFLWNCFV